MLGYFTSGSVVTCAKVGCGKPSYNGRPGSYCSKVCRMSCLGSHEACPRKGCPCAAPASGVHGGYCCAACFSGTPCEVATHLRKGGPVRCDTGRSVYIAWRDDDVLGEWVSRFLGKAYHVVGEDAVKSAQSKKDKRDGVLSNGASIYHITLCGSFERTQSGKAFASLDDFNARASKLRLSQARPLGMGLLQESGNFALMVIVEWPELQELRKRYGLKPNSPHITVGFQHSDIHNQPKDRRALI